MTYQVSAMTQMNESGLTRFCHSLLGRVTLVFLTAVDVAAVFAFIYLGNKTIAIMILQLVNVLAIGLSAGFAARQLLYEYRGALRATSSLVAAFAGLVSAHLLTRGLVGVQINDPNRTGPDWYGLIQIALAGFMALVSSRRWRRRVITPMGEFDDVSEPVEPLPEVIPPQPVNQVAPSIVTPKRLKTGYWRDLGSRIGVRLSSLGSGVSDFIRQPQVGTGRERSIRAADSSRGIRLRKSRVNLGRKGRYRSRASAMNSRVRLVGEEEHRCPYCLDIVRLYDPRGVEVCPICHTHHHADCWAVTGTCQVPHHHV